ncbi:hypothetical protein [Helicobacter sp. T3_23-1056]
MAFSLLFCLDFCKSLSQILALFAYWILIVIAIIIQNFGYKIQNFYINFMYGFMNVSNVTFCVFGVKIKDFLIMAFRYC